MASQGGGANPFQQYQGAGVQQASPGNSYYPQTATQQQTYQQMPQAGAGKYGGMTGQQSVPQGVPPEVSQQYQQQQQRPFQAQQPNYGALFSSLASMFGGQQGRAPFSNYQPLQSANNFQLRNTYQFDPATDPSRQYAARVKAEADQKAADAEAAKAAADAAAQSQGQQTSYEMGSPGNARGGRISSPDKKIRAALLTAKGVQAKAVPGKSEGGDVTSGDNFKSWFGNSVAHEDGVPTRFYHGTSKDKDFTSFNMGRHGVWLTADPKEASEYAEVNDSQGHVFEDGKFKSTNTASRVMPVYLKAENPYTGKRPEHVVNANNYKKAQSDWFDQLRAAGYDSWIPESANGKLAVALKHPTQIKSAVSNTGKFSSSEKHIGKMEGGALAAPGAHEEDGGRVGYAGGGGEEYQDPQSDVIKDWNWRPLADVQNDLQLTEIPSHVQAFGKFMDETAAKASGRGLTPRDLIKAYTITRSSIQRQAVDSNRVRAAGLALPDDVTGKIRPEGAFGEWLHSDMGQRYLRAAERGEVDPEAVRHAVQVMAPFGKHEKDIPDALIWAAKNLPGREKYISDLVARGRDMVSTPEEWRAMTKDVRGIGPSKSGFVASLLGRGDQPTLDARQVILHTGRPTKEASPMIAKKGGKGGVEAVDRLAARQEAMGLTSPELLKPYYQHLAHHTVWDKAGNEETTHEDVMNAMRHAATGGAITAHPLVDAMRAAGLPGLGGVERDGLRDGGSPNDDIVKQALERVSSPFSQDPKMIVKALETASSLRVPQNEKTGTGSYYSIKQPMAVSDVTANVLPIPGVNPVARKDLTWEDFYKQGKGGTFINLGGDRSNLGRLTHINDKPLAWHVDLHAGPKYMTEPNPGLVWANNPNHATALRNKILEAAEKGPVYGVYAPMGTRSVDSSHNMFDAVMAQIPGANISKNDAEEFDKSIKNGLHVKGKDSKSISLRKNAMEKLEKWPGILNAKEASEFARNLPGGHRSAIIKYLDSDLWRKKNFPAIGVTRVAITDPELKSASGNMLGHRVVKLDPESIVQETAMKHSTYTSPTGGEYVGDVPLVQRHYAAPDVVEELLRNPTKSGEIVHPYSVDDYGRSTFRKLFEEQKQLQPVNERMINSIGEGLMRQKDYGLKKGGIVDKALQLTRKPRK
jgi:hypothetical protein